MPSKPLEIYQGSDWLTHRWSAAQAFDTLDRIRDLCLHTPLSSASPLPHPNEPHYEISDDEITDIFGYIVELCDDLGGEIDMVHADLFVHLQANLINRWAAFEMRLILKDIRLRALKEAEAPQPSHAPPEAISALVARLKNLLKQLDQ